MSIRLIKIDSPQTVIDYLAQAIRTHLQAGEHVLWLVSGGSVIPPAATIAQRLAKVQLDRLTVSLSDERPGPVGHVDSNWQQLLAAGFALPGAHLHPVLTGADTLADTAALDQFLHEQLNAANYKIGLFGIGPDGHTAGLPAVGAKSPDRLAEYYEATDFRRISSTPTAIARLSEAVAYVMGEPKRVQIDRLQSDLPITEQSAQALKLAPQLTVFNEFKGEPV